MTEPLLRLEELQLYFPQRRSWLSRPQYLRAVDGVSLDIFPGETLGLVGESGCGKSSLGKAILNLHPPTGGRAWFAGQEMTGLSSAQMRPLRRDLQMIFQDPFESLNSRHTVANILEEPLIIHRLAGASERQRTVAALLDRVGLPRSAANKYPHEFSGGQRQRIGIARAIALKPRLLICDEPVSALDVSVQAQILNLLLEIQQEMGLAMLFISHDLSVVRHMSDRIAVMYLGKLVETGAAEQLYRQPAHPYTQVLLNSVPRIGQSPAPVEQLVSLGEPPSPLARPRGCAYQSRCSFRSQTCTIAVPELSASGNNGQVACHHWQQVQKLAQSGVKTG